MFCIVRGSGKIARKHYGKKQLRLTHNAPMGHDHPKSKATFNQRELRHDFNNYPTGLRAPLRQAPKVILVGEMRDRATITKETARLFASRKSRITRGIDLIQKARGVDSDLDSGLRLDLPENAFR